MIFFIFISREKRLINLMIRTSQKANRYVRKEYRTAEGIGEGTSPGCGYVLEEVFQKERISLLLGEHPLVCPGSTKGLFASQVNVRRNLAMHCSVTPFIIRQPICRPRLPERVYKPMCTSH